jgi:hypothetical protein
MTISISNLLVNNNAPPGTVVGVLTAWDASGTVLPCNFTLTKNSAGFFAISGNNLVTAWSGSAAASNCFVRVHAIGTDARFSGNALFTVLINLAAPPPPPPPPPPPLPPPPPPPPSIKVNGSSNAVVAEGSALTVSLVNGTGNTTDWVGLAGAGTPDTSFIAWVYLSGSQTAPDVGLTSATLMMTAPTTDGSYEARFYANNSWTVLARTIFTVQGTAVTVTPANPAIADTGVIGTQVATYTVTMSDGSPFTGTATLTVNP